MKGMIAQASWWYDCPESCGQRSNKSNVFNTSRYREGVGVDLECVDHQEQFMPRCRCCIPLDGLIDLVVYIQSDLQKDLAEDLVKAEGFAIYLSCQAKGEEGNSFQTLGSSKNLVKSAQDRMLQTHDLKIDWR